MPTCERQGSVRTSSDSSESESLAPMVLCHSCARLRCWPDREGGAWRGVAWRGALACGKSNVASETVLAPRV